MIHNKNRCRDYALGHTIQKFAMVDCHSSNASNKLKITEMLLIAKPRKWVYLKRIVVPEIEIKTRSKLDGVLRYDKTQ